jgi:hypothetical protein
LDDCVRVAQDLGGVGPGSERRLEIGRRLAAHGDPDGRAPGFVQDADELRRDDVRQLVDEERDRREPGHALVGVLRPDVALEVEEGHLCDCGSGVEPEHGAEEEVDDLPALLAAMGFAIVLPACDRHDREDAHRKTERAIDREGDKIEKAGDKIEEKTDPD